MYVSSFRTGRWLAPARRSLVYTRVYRILLSPRCTIELVYYCKLEPRVRVCVRGSTCRKSAQFGLNTATVIGAASCAHARRGRADTLVSRVRDARKTYCMGQIRAPTLSRVPAVVNGRVAVWRGRDAAGPAAAPRPARHPGDSRNVPPIVPPIATRIRFACISRGLGLLARTRLTTRLTGRVLITGLSVPRVPKVMALVN
jgi:hypothetical protein